MHDEVCGCLIGRVDHDALRRDRRHELRAGERARPRQHRLDRRQAAAAGVLVEPELLAPAPVRPVHVRADELHDPPYVGGGKHVQGAAHRPCPNDATGVAGLVDVAARERRGTRAHRQARCGCRLRLQRHHPSNRVDHVGRPLADQQLRAQPQRKERLGGDHVRHAGDDSHPVGGEPAQSRGRGPECHGNWHALASQLARCARHACRAICLNDGANAKRQNPPVRRRLCIAMHHRSHHDASLRP